jgi:hypothetical protein
MVTEIIDNYQFLVNNLGNLIEVSGYRNDYIAKKIGVQASNFSVKKQRGNWTVTEANKLLQLLTVANPDVQDYIDSKILDARNTGNRMTSEEFKSRLTWK